MAPLTFGIGLEPFALGELDVHEPPLERTHRRQLARLSRRENFVGELEALGYLDDEDAEEE